MPARHHQDVTREHQVHAQYFANGLNGIAGQCFVARIFSPIKLVFIAIVETKINYSFIGDYYHEKM